jgi:uncharacterized membrane protein
MLTAEGTRPSARRRREGAVVEHGQEQSTLSALKAIDLSINLKDPDFNCQRRPHKVRACPSSSSSTPVSPLRLGRLRPACRAPGWAVLQGWRRRLLFVALYEGLAIVCSSWGMARDPGDGLAHASVMGVAASAIAVLWNLLFTTLFERWKRHCGRGRSLARRAAHAIGFEGGLLIVCAPVCLVVRHQPVGIAADNLGLLLFFLVYTSSTTGASTAASACPRAPPLSPAAHIHLTCPSPAAWSGSAPRSS